MNTRGSPRSRNLPTRTYGSREGSRRSIRPNDGQQTACSAEGSSIHKSPSEANRLSLQQSARKFRGGFSGVTSVFPLQRSAGSLGDAVGGSTRSAEEISALVGAAGQGDDGSAIALAQACKSRATRKAMRSNAGGVLVELTSALLSSLQAECMDEALVHGLTVAMFVLSKDRTLVKAFSASAVSTLAVLIEGRIRQGGVGEDSVGGKDAVGAPSVAATAAADRRENPLFSVAAATGTICAKDRYCGGGNSSAFAAKSRSEAASSFDMDDEDKEDAHVVIGGSFGKAPGGARSAKADRRIRDANASGSSSSNDANRGVPPQVSKNVAVRARMLLDIADMVPWGMANRHLVSAADLGLAALLNIASQATADGEGGGGAAGCVAVGKTLDEESSTQGSMGSQSEPSSFVGALVNGQANGGETTTARYNAGVVPELSRLASTGFLLPLVVGGAAVLGDMSAGSSSSAGGDHAGRARINDAAADPSLLRSVHKLLLALRLLDLATLENSGDGRGVATKDNVAAKFADTFPLHHNAELLDALLRVVANCLPICGGGGSTGGTSVGGGGGYRRVLSRSPQPVVGNEVAARVHECLLAALRVLINVTHHDARVCSEVASRGGLDTLMSCLVARSYCWSQGSDNAGSRGGLSYAPPRSDLALLEDVLNGVGEDMPGSGLEQGGGDSGGESSSGEGDFDAQVLVMSALINCVELKESAENCAAMASLAVRPCAARAAPKGRTVHGDKEGRDQQPIPFAGCVSGGGLVRSKCLAPEFLAKLLIRCTRSFASQLEADRSDEEDVDEPASSASAPRGQHGSGRSMGEHVGLRDGGGSTTVLAPKTAEPMVRATPATPQEGGGGEQLMSHAEGTDLVLGGHCALLLGLLVRRHEGNRRLALPVLPNGDPTLIVRVLEAFMALQFQAGVLTEEMVLAVQELVEELEGLEPLRVEEWNPFGIEAAVETSAPDASTPADAAVTPSPSRRGRKRPRTPASKSNTPVGVQRTFATPPSGQWAVEAGGGDDGGVDDFWLSSVERPPIAPSREQAPSSLGTSQASAIAAASGERLVASTPSESPGGSDARQTTPPPSPSRTLGSTTTAPPSWGVGSTSIAGRISLGLRGRSAAKARSWLGGSSRLRTYGNTGAYGSQTWNGQASRPSSGGRASSSFGDEGLRGQEGESSRAVVEIFSEDSADGTDASLPMLVVRGGGGGSGGSSSSGNRGGSKGRSTSCGKAGPTGRGSAMATAATSSSFDVDNWSDSSDEPPTERGTRKEMKGKGARVPTCQLQSLMSGGGGDDSNSDDDIDGGCSQSTPGEQRGHSPTPSPTALRPVVQAECNGPIPPRRAGARGVGPRGVGPRSGWSRRGSTMDAVAKIATATGRRPGQALTGEGASRLPASGASRPAREGSGGELAVRPQRSMSLVAVGRRDGQGATVDAGVVGGACAGEGAGAGALRGPAASDWGGRGPVGGFRGPVTRTVLGAEGAGGAEGLLEEKTSARNVFKMDDEDESD